MSGIFFQRVVIAESDADCLFYSAILEVPEVRGQLQPDVLFIHASGKHRLAALAEALRALDVPVDVIADIDILKEENVLQHLIVALGGNWDDIQRHATALRKAIEEHKPWLNSAEVAKGVGEILKKSPTTGEFPKQLCNEIDAIFRKASPWDALKDSGEAAIPAGEATKHYKDLRKLCEQARLWIVPVGQVEGFCRSIGGHGPRWVQEVIETKNLATDAELEPARKFVRRLWARDYLDSPVMEVFEA